MTRLLLPFTHGVDAQAIDVAVRFAHYHQATLVPLVLIAGSSKGWFFRGPRLEAFQQAQDFFAVVRHKAEQYNVPVECVQLVTSESIGSSILTAAYTQACESIVLLVRRKKGLLLHSREITSLLRQRKHSLSLIHLLPPQSNRRRGISAPPPGEELDAVASAFQKQEALPLLPIAIHVETHNAAVEEVRRIPI